MNNEFERKLVT